MLITFREGAPADIEEFLATIHCLAGTDRRAAAARLAVWVGLYCYPVTGGRQRSRAKPA